MLTKVLHFFKKLCWLTKLLHSLITCSLRKTLHTFTKVLLPQETPQMFNQMFAFTQNANLLICICTQKFCISQRNFAFNHKTFIFTHKIFGFFQKMFVLQETLRLQSSQNLCKSLRLHLCYIQVTRFPFFSSHVA